MDCKLAGAAAERQRLAQPDPRSGAAEGLQPTSAPAGLPSTCLRSWCLSPASASSDAKSANNRTPMQCGGSAERRAASTLGRVRKPGGRGQVASETPRAGNVEWTAMQYTVCRHTIWSRGRTLFRLGAESDGRSRKSAGTLPGGTKTYHKCAVACRDVVDEASLVGAPVGEAEQSVPVHAPVLPLALELHPARPGVGPDAVLLVSAPVAHKGVANCQTRPEAGHASQTTAPPPPLNESECRVEGAEYR
eukprot:1435181-Rhodomonas_salina.1